jgi:hypothetical protein
MTLRVSRDLLALVLSVGLLVPLPASGQEQPDAATKTADTPATPDSSGTDKAPASVMPPATDFGKVVPLDIPDAGAAETPRGFIPGRAGARNDASDTSPALLPPVAFRPPMPPGPGITGVDRSADYAYGAFQRGWYLTALSLATPRAEQGDTAAQTLLGVLYETGRGLPRDAEKAASWYSLAAEGGNAQAAMRYGLMLLNGLGVEQDEKKAGDMFEVAAKADIAEAIYNLAGLYRTGEGRPYDPDKAFELLKQAAELDDMDARFQLAQFYLDGPADIRDEGRAAFWMGRAARQGHVGAQVRYAILRFNGRGVAPDEAEAADWFERAARAGNPVAMNRLARILALGRGREVDVQAAAGWHLAARSLGISDLQLDATLANLTPEELEEARAFARGFATAIEQLATDEAAITP